MSCRSVTDMTTTDPINLFEVAEYQLKDHLPSYAFRKQDHDSIMWSWTTTEREWRLSIVNCAPRTGRRTALRLYSHGNGREVEVKLPVEETDPMVGLMRMLNAIPGPKIHVTVEGRPL